MQMIQQIVFLLRKRKPDAPPEWIQKLPEMARRLEDRLYRVAQSKMEYQNMATLKQRLQDVAIKMGAKAKHSQQSHSSSSAPRSALLKAIREAAQAGQIRQHPKEGPVVVVRINDETQMVPISRLKREQQDEVYEMYKAHRDQQSRRAGGGGASGHHRGGVNPRDVNPQMAGLNPSSYGSSSGSDAMRAKMSGGHSRPPSGSTAPPRNTDEHRKAIMRQQQQRLLLLRHASKCQEKRGKCKATALCAQMKELWQHIAQCKDQHCLHPHCVSSRYVLSHYHRCKQRNCEVCAPVRLAIQKQNNQKRPSSKKSKSKKAAKAPPQVTVKPPEPQKQKPRMPTQQSLIDTWSHATIQAHLENLNRLFNPYYTKQVMKDSMLPLLKKLTEEEYGWIFNKPVDPLELGLPDYFDIISKPMDLGTVRKNLEKGKYKLPAAVSDDVNLCFDNAMKYNPDDSEVYQLALRFKKIFMKSFRIEASSLREKEHKQRENENSCKLCGGEMFQFEPPVYYCNGTCGTRIRRNSYYHVTPDNKGHYCMQCYGKLDETIQVGENVIPKANLQKKKNDDNTEESWVQCETCDGWMHQICAVFNSRQNDNDDAEIKYTCAVCLAKQREHLGENVPPPKKGTLPYLSAKELPKTELSNFLEKRVRTLEKEYGEAHPELKVPETTLRVVSHKTNPCYTKVEMHKEYCDAEGYPTQFDYISKCILMFQNLDGVEVLLFGFYIQEYDDECPEPNRRRCYLAYLDSVKYFEPPALRSPMYQTILNGYFAHAKMRGFVAGYIWACPPLKGDDYILYCHPESQMIPKAERLRLWYHKMIDRAIAEGIVIERTNIYDEHMVPKPRARYAIAGQFAGVHEPPSEEYFKQRKKRRDQELEEELQREEAIARKAQAHDRKLRKEAEAKKVAEKLKAEKEKRAAAVAAAKAAAAGVTVKPEPGAASAAASEGAKAPAAAAAAAEKAAAPGAMEVDVPAADAAAKDASKADAAGSSASSSTKAAAGGSADKAPKSAASGAGAMEVEEGAKVADKAAGADEEKKADSDADVSSGAVAVKAKKKLAPWLVTPTPLPIGAGDSEMLDVTSLPYFDGDYWPGVMEDLLREKVSTKKKELPTPAEAKAEKAAAKAAEEKEKNSSAARRRARSERRTGDAEKDGDDDEEDDKDGKGKGGKGKSIANKPARVTRRTSSRNAPTPENLGPTAAELEGLEKGIAINLQKLQPKLETMKADFIVIKLHYQCSCCHQYILFGNIWRKPEVNDTSAAVAAAAASAPTPSIEDATPSASGAATPMTSTSTATSVAGTPANERAEGVPSAAAQTAAAAKDVAAAAAKLTAKASGVGSLSARGMNTRGGNSHRSKPPKSKSTSHRKAKGAKVEQKIGGTSHENKSSAQSRVDNHWMGSQHRSPASVLNTPFKLCDSCVQAQMMLPIMERLADFSDDMVPTPMKVDADMMEECTDRDRQISSEFFDKRQQFLTLCQGNHYQCVCVSLSHSFSACARSDSLPPPPPPPRACLQQIRPAPPREALVDDGDLAHAPPEDACVRSLVQHLPQGHRFGPPVGVRDVRGL